MSVHLTKNKVQRTHMIHLLIADAFLPKVDGLDGVRHLDENKANNAAYNLERCSINEIKYTSGRSHHLYRHGESFTRLHGIWENMKQRCNNEKSPSYKNYGGRRISVCKDWDDSFESFSLWAKQNGYSDKLTIDRINNDGNYEPTNCRWVNRKTQANNTRRNLRLTYEGRSQSITQWCEELSLSKSAVKYRLDKGMSVKDTFAQLLSKEESA